MQKNMQRNAAVYRTEKTLKEGCDRIDATYESFKDVKINDKGLVWNTDLLETLELENLLRNFNFTQCKLNRPSTLLLTEKSHEVPTPETTILKEMTNIS